MSAAASAHPPAKPCLRTQGNLDDLLKEADKNAIRFDRYFFTNDTYESKEVPLQFRPRADLLPNVVRCIECGKTIGEHLPDVNNQQPKTCGGLLVQDRVQGVVVNLRLFNGDPMGKKGVDMFAVVDVVIDTGCNFTLILASGVFDEMVEKLNLESVPCHAQVTNQQALDQCIPAVFVQLPHVKDDNGAPLTEVMKIYRGDAHVSLFGLQALELFHVGVLPSKEIFRWASTFCGYAVQNFV